MTPISLITQIAVVDAVPAPWWGVPVIAGAFLVLGAVLGFAFNRFNEKRKETREDRTKWHDELRLEAAQLLSLAHRLDLEAPGLHSGREDMAKNETNIEAINDYLKLSDKVVEAMTELVLIHSTIRIIAPQAVGDQAGKVVDAAGEVMTKFTKKASASLNSEMNEFLKEVRLALNIHPGT